jgi:hypothetical protein
MTAAARTGVRLGKPLSEGDVAYVDRDWLGVGEGMATPSLTWTAGRGLRWPGGDWIELPHDTSPDYAAAAMFDELARAVTAALPADGPVAVPGSGLLATIVRDLLAKRAAFTERRPCAVVETSGHTDRLAQAVDAVADLGTVVLAATPLGGTVTLELYTNVHKRGLRLIGVAAPADKPPARAVSAVPPPVDLGVGGPPPLSGTWFAIRA